MANTELPHWHVIGDQVREQASLAPSGTGIETMWEVPYMVDSGPAKGSQHKVLIDPRDFVPATVEQAIREHLSNVHNVAQLGHPVA